MNIKLIRTNLGTQVLFFSPAAGGPCFVFRFFGLPQKSRIGFRDSRFWLKNVVVVVEVEVELACWFLGEESVRERAARIAGDRHDRSPKTYDGKEGFVPV